MNRPYTSWPHKPMTPKEKRATDRRIQQDKRDLQEVMRQVNSKSSKMGRNE